jgi:hypothetical protein
VCTAFFTRPWVSMVSHVLVAQIEELLHGGDLPAHRLHYAASHALRRALQASMTVFGVAWVFFDTEARWSTN